MVVRCAEKAVSALSGRAGLCYRGAVRQQNGQENRARKMAQKRRPLVAGNWKMNGLAASLAELDRMVAGSAPASPVDVMVCPPATLVAAFAARAKARLSTIGGQDCHAQPSGAFTGDIAAEMLQGRRRRGGHRRPFRAAHDPWRDRCRRSGQGQGRLARGPDSRSSASAKRWTSATPAARSMS